MVRLARKCLLVLIAFAVIAGTSSRVAHAAEQASPMTMAGMPCGVLMSHAGMPHDKPAPPCNGMKPGCMKQMCCATDCALPARVVNFDIAALFSGAHYWPAWSNPANFVPEPEPLPPRTI